MTSNSTIKLSNINLTICAFSDVAKLLNDNKYDAIISIKNPKTRSVWTNMELETRFKRFKDHPNQEIDEKYIICMSFIDTIDMNEHGCPKNNEICRIINLANNIKEHHKFLEICMNDTSKLNILVHCIKGISRSSASAIILLEELGFTREMAMSKVMDSRPIAIPNPLMLKIYTDSKNV